jgi:hypothetical protein
MPPRGWTPDPRWGPAPEGWELYVEEAKPEEPPDTSEEKPQGRSIGKRRRWEIATTWISTLTAVAALALSGITYVQLNGEVDVHLVMPKVIRISDPNPAGFQDIYLQPTFTATRRTDRPAVLLNMTLLVEPQEDGEDMPAFSWHEVVDLTQSEVEDTTVYRTRLSDPVPILVFGSEPVSPMARFIEETPNPTLIVGTLQATLRVDWQNRPAMEEDLCIEVSQETVDAFADPEKNLIRRFIKYPSSECYLFFA